MAKGFTDKNGKFRPTGNSRSSSREKSTEVGGMMIPQHKPMGIVPKEDLQFLSNDMRDLVDDIDNELYQLIADDDGSLGGDIVDEINEIEKDLIIIDADKKATENVLNSLRVQGGKLDLHITEVVRGMEKILVTDDSLGDILDRTLDEMLIGSDRVGLDYVSEIREIKSGTRKLDKISEELQEDVLKLRDFIQFLDERFTMNKAKDVADRTKRIETGLKNIKDTSSDLSVSANQLFGKVEADFG